MTEVETLKVEVARLKAEIVRLNLYIRQLLEQVGWDA